VLDGVTDPREVEILGPTPAKACSCKLQPTRQSYAEWVRFSVWSLSTYQVVYYLDG